MIILHDTEWHVTSKSEALYMASNYTGFDKNDFKCEVIKEPKRVGLFKKEDGIFHCWYEYEGMDADKKIKIVDAQIYVDTKQKKMLVTRFGFKAYEIDYSDMVDYEIVTSSSNQTCVISNKNKALKGGILFGTVGAIIGAADSETVLETSELAELIIRLKFRDKEPFEILTCNQLRDTSNEYWRDTLEQGKAADEFFRELLKEQ